MHYLSFKNFLYENTEVPVSFFESHLDKIKRVEVKKGDILLRQGAVCKHTFFVESGLLKYYSIDDKGKTHVLQFAPEGWFVSDRESSFYNQPSSYFIDAQEDSTILLLEYNLFEELAKINPEFEKMNTRLLHRHILQLQNRIHLLLSASAEQRYQSFINTYPDLLLRVPQHLVASYLGVTPEGLSRIRKELAERNFSKVKKV